MKQQTQCETSLCRDLYTKTGYVFAKSPDEIAKMSGFTEIARLGSNENPYPPSPAVLKAAADALASANRYPDPKAESFTEAIRRHIYDSPVVTSGLGMDGVIETVIRALIAPGDKVVVSTPTFSMYGIAAAAASAVVVNVPRLPDFSVDVDAFIREAKDAKLSFLCTPNNPTGTVTPVSDIEKILDSITGVLFLDNAYVEFCDADYLSLLKKYDNLIIGRTLSKVYGLAGLRVGYGFVPQWLEGPYHAAATPFTLNRVSEAAAVAALADESYRDNFIAHVRKWRSVFVKEIPYPVIPSGANFVLFDTAPLLSNDAMELFAKQGVLVRSCASFPGLGDTFVRVSVGDVWENERFLVAVKQL
ncbi:Histidinol-phosphate aminotransferase [Methanocorpusculaceae archaeon Sp1]|nr:Histidinol-phosphate aminotransferase [Methanocorpusculaceae archaeon Sp1]